MADSVSPAAPVPRWSLTIDNRRIPEIAYCDEVFRTLCTQGWLQPEDRREWFDFWLRLICVKANNPGAVICRQVHKGTWRNPEALKPRPKMAPVCCVPFGPGEVRSEGHCNLWEAGETATPCRNRCVMSDEQAARELLMRCLRVFEDVASWLRKHSENDGAP